MGASGFDDDEGEDGPGPADAEVEFEVESAISRRLLHERQFDF